MNQLRDNKGRFIKEPELFKTRPAKDYYRSDEVPNPFEDYYDVEPEEELKIAPSVRLAIWLSHNRLEILFHLAYVVLCVVVAYYSARFGLFHHL